MTKKRSVQRRKGAHPWWVWSMNICLGFFAVVIITTMMLPSVFGMQNFRQWAGMYVDNWCQATVYSGPPGAADTVSMDISVGRYARSPEVWTAPSHNQYSCARWVYDMMCGQKTQEGWTVVSARPFFGSQKYYLGDFNVCAYPFNSLPWFTHAL